jgi:trimeric autotransporter adhesin
MKTLRRFVIAVPLFLSGNMLLAQSSLALSSGSSPAGSPVSLNLSLASTGNQPAGLQWTFTYPSASVSGFVVTAGPALTAVGKTLNCAGSSTGYTCIASGINNNLIANGSVATVTVNLIGTASASIGVSSSIGVAFDSTSITTTATGGTATTFAVPVLSGLACTPASLTPGAIAACTATMSGPMVSAATIAVSSTGSITVPATVSISANSATATFNATAGSFTAGQPATVTAALNAVNATANISLVALQISSLQCASTTLAASASTTCTVAISAPAPSNGSTVSLASSLTSALTVPASVLVQSGATSATFTATAAAVNANQNATVTASLGASTASAAFSITAPTTIISSLQCASTTLAASASTTCTVAISAPAPSNGSTISLASSLTSALTVPASVLVQSGATSATFTATAAAVNANQNATVTASLGASTASVAFSITAPTGPASISSLQCASTTLTPNMSTACTVTLSNSAPNNGIPVAISTSAATMLNMPPSVLVAAGANSAGFNVTAGKLAIGQTATIRAVYGGTSLSVAISLSPNSFALSQLTCPAQVVPGLSGTCSVTLTAPTPSASLVSLKSTNAGLAVPPSLTLPAASSTASFQFNSSSNVNGWVIVSATMGGITKTANVQAIAPPHSSSPASVVQPSLACDHRHLNAGASAICEIRFTPSDSQAVEFSIASSSASLKVPVTIRPQAHANSVRFEVFADPEARQNNVTIETVSHLGSAQASLAVLSSGAPLLRVPSMRNTRIGSQVAFLATAVDAQDQPIPVSISGLPRGASFDPSTGEFAWTPLDSDAGSATITFTATDWAGLKTTKAVQIHIISGQPVITGMRNGAGANAPAACSPGARMTLLGTFVADDQQAAAGAIGVRVNGEPVPVVGASAAAVDFLCPTIPAGTPLSVTAEVAGRVSEEWKALMEETAPGLFSANGSGSGQGLITHARGLAALPRLEMDGTPAVAGDTVSLYATGINCSESSTDRLPLIYFGTAVKPVTSITPSTFAGICELRAVVPEGISGSRVELFLETARTDATLVRSNSVSLAIDEPARSVN